MTGAPPLRYVGLGDSYTIGTSVAPDERWPNQLVARLAGEPQRLELIANLGVNGFTSQNLIDRELPQLEALDPEFVSVLIGVNDVVQGVPAERFRENAARILEDLIARVGVARIVVVTTPDYTVTPAGADFGDPQQQSFGIRRNNGILTELAADHEIAVVDVYDISLRAADDRTLVADDGLHPSGAQYALWVDAIAPIVEGLVAP